MLWEGLKTPNPCFTLAALGTRLEEPLPKPRAAMESRMSHIGVSQVMGDPQVTMGFNTKS